MAMCTACLHLTQHQVPAAAAAAAAGPVRMAARQQQHASVGHADLALVHVVVAAAAPRRQSGMSAGRADLVLVRRPPPALRLGKRKIIWGRIKGQVVSGELSREQSNHERSTAAPPKPCHHRHDHLTLTQPCGCKGGQAAAGCEHHGAAAGLATGGTAKRGGGRGRGRSSILCSRCNNHSCHAAAASALLAALLLLLAAGWGLSDNDRQVKAALGQRLHRAQGATPHECEQRCKRSKQHAHGGGCSSESSSGGKAYLGQKGAR